MCEEKCHNHSSVCSPWRVQTLFSEETDSEGTEEGTGQAEETFTGFEVPRNGRRMGFLLCRLLWWDSLNLQAFNIYTQSITLIKQGTKPSMDMVQCKTTDMIEILKLDTQIAFMSCHFVIVG